MFHIAMLVLGVALAGCSRQDPATDSWPAATQRIEDEWVDEQPEIRRDAVDDWSRFSFSGFGISLPRDFRVMAMDEGQENIELVNFGLQDFERNYNANEDAGRFRVTVSTEPAGSGVERVVDRATQLGLKVGGETAYSLPLENGEGVVVVVASQQQKAYYFKFGFDFAREREFQERVLETVVFHSRETLD